MKIETIDLDFMDTPQVVASFLLVDDDGTSAALVETGPTTCLERLTTGLKDRGVSPEDVRQVYLTHIHLDHAGASGHLSGLLPNATFSVPEVGIIILKDGEETEAAGGVLVAHDTPGHAYHHLAYLEPDSGALFTGDVAGIRL